MKHLLLLETLGTKENELYEEFLNVLHVTGSAAAINYTRHVRDSTWVVSIDINYVPHTLFKNLDEKEARLICSQINDWVKTFVTSQILPPLL